MKKINYLDCFSGIGGFHEGLRQAEFNFNWVGFSEINKYAKSIYLNHFNNSVELGNVNSVLSKKLPKKIDLFTFGFPCQDLSIAGKREGLKASRSGLFFKAMQIIRITRPTYFIFENVKGLFSSNEGKDWLTVLEEVADSGYDGQWQVLNTRWFLPQNRERIYFIGHFRGECRPKIFPIKGKSKGFTKSQKGAKNKEQRFWSRYYCRTLKPNVADGMATLLQVKQNVRRFTPVECERFQGFSDNWTKYGVSNNLILDGQRYKCLGNAVSIPVIKVIAEKLIKYF